MKLKNPLVTRSLRVFYFEKKWKHEEVQRYLANHFSVFVCVRTLKYWKKRLSNPFWQCPVSPKPPVPKVKASQEQILRICKLRKKTGWGALPLKYLFNFNISESTYKRIIRLNGLSRGSKIENKRIHWVKWQREHPDSLWQLDGHKDDECNWILPVIDDCSRFCTGLKKFETLTTEIVTNYLEELFKIHGIPRELLTDNGTEFGGFCRTSQFDQWCKKWKIKHIRARPKKPTTPGKIERHHLTFNNEIKFCGGDMELFRYRYNHIRPHRSLHMRTPAQVYFDLQIRIKGIGFNQSKW